MSSNRMKRNQIPATKDYTPDTNLRRARKKYLVELAGGQCEWCGFRGHDAVFDFHHIKHGTKKYSISNGLGFSEEIYRKEILPEIEKCMLLCANCHRTVHAIR